MSTALNSRAADPADISHFRLTVPAEVAFNAALGAQRSTDVDGREYDSADWPDGKRILVGAALVNQLNFEGHHSMADAIQAILAVRWPGRFQRGGK